MTARIFRLLVSTAGIAGLALPLLAASHSDAPLSKQDPQANFTDVYAFIGTKYDDDDTKVLNVVAAFRPFSEPGDGVIYDRFAPDVRYSIHIASPTTGKSVVQYDFRFSSVTSGYKNLDTVLSYGLGTEAGPIEDIGDARQNYTQTYSVRRNSVLLGDDLVTAPPNVGKNVTPHYNDSEGRAVSGAADYAALDRYTQQAIHDLPSGEVVFAGQRDDGFFSDIPGIFDLLDVRILGQDGNGVDGFKGFNVLVYAIQIPLSKLPSFSYDSVFFGSQTGVGVYASASRPRIRVLLPNGKTQYSGPWVQVNRMGNPLFNEGLVALRDKDKFNRTSPTSDKITFAKYAENPELATLINFVFDTSFADTGRADLVNVFIPEVLRVNTTTDPVRLAGQAGFSRLGFLGGDTTNGISSGWPNGRRLGDDVVDIALTAVASGPGYGSITVVGDNVPSNDIDYHQVFPYSATPHSGTLNRKDPE